MSGHQSRILVVDDEPDVQRLVKFRLESEGYVVSIGKNGWEALDAIRERRPNLVIADLSMPHLDGFGLLRRLRADPTTAALPVLLLTARDRAIDLAIGLEAGADDYMSKPFEFLELVARVKALLRRAGDAPAVTVAEEPPTGRLVAFIGAKGGVGTTTIAANVGVAIARSNAAAILADLSPVRGTVTSLLSLAPIRGIDRLPTRHPEAITREAVAESLIAHPSGLRLLVGPSGATAVSPDAVSTVLRHLRQLAPLVLTDLDSSINRFSQAVLAEADQVWLIVQPEPASLDRAALMLQLMEHVVRPSRIAVLVNQTRPGMVFDPAVVVARTGFPVAHLVRAAPEAYGDAANRGRSLVEYAPQQPASQSLCELASTIAGGRPLQVPVPIAASGSLSAR